jgi:hypothetical protein
MAHVPTPVTAYGLSEVSDQGGQDTTQSGRSVRLIVCLTTEQFLCATCTTAWAVWTVQDTPDREYSLAESSSIQYELIFCISGNDGINLVSDLKGGTETEGVREWGAEQHKKSQQEAGEYCIMTLKFALSLLPMDNDGSFHGGKAAGARSWPLTSN